MPDLPVIFLAVGDGSSVWEVAVWLVVGAVWIVSQVAASRKKREQAQRREAARAEGASPRPGSPSPAPDELAEIFKRLGADIPATPPPPARRPAGAAPPPRPPRRPPPPPTAPRPVYRAAPQRHSAPSKIQPDIARRLARAKAEAAKAAHEAETAWHIPPLTDIQGVTSRHDDNQSIQAATRTSGLVLPRLHAMDLRLSKFPAIPMPTLSQTQRRAPPLPILLHGRRELKRAIVAQALLHAPKSEFRM